jgi:hypothetical protein
MRPRSRIGSDEARKWARTLPLGNPLAKSILVAIANYMNEDGAAWPGIQTLHADTDIAEDTIVNRLRWLEGIGVVALLKTWVDENGRRNHDGRGRTTSNEIRFLFDVDLEELEAAIAGISRPKALRGAALRSHEVREVSPRHGREQNESQDQEVSPPASPRLAPDSPPTPADRREEPKNPESPYSPPQAGGDGPDELSDGEASEADRRLALPRKLEALRGGMAGTDRVSNAVPATLVRLDRCRARGGRRRRAGLRGLAHLAA